MKRNSKQFLALFIAAAMSVTPVSYAYAEDNAAGVESAAADQQTAEVTDGGNDAANAAKQPTEEVTGQEEEKAAGQEADDSQNAGEEPKAEAWENAAAEDETVR